MTLTLKRLPYRLAVCRLDPRQPVDDRMHGTPFFSWTRTEDEISIVCLEDDVPSLCLESRRGWSAFKVQGPLDFSLTGILSSLTAPLAAQGIPVFALSTYDTDYLLVPAEHESQAQDTLRAAGFDWVDVED